MKTVESRIVSLARKLGVVRPRDLRDHNIPREYAQRLLARGSLTRVGRGLYTLPDASISANRSLAEVTKAVPKGVVCLLSALRFHGLTTQNPREVWLAVESKAWRPRRTPFPVRLVHLSGRALGSGIGAHRIDGVAVRIYSPAKTVADCFKFRNKVGLDVAVEALRDYLARNRGGADELWRFARICRVTRVIQPYLEAVL